jgi:hypothetical protein
VKSASRCSVSAPSGSRREDTTDTPQRRVSTTIGAQTEQRTPMAGRVLFGSGRMEFRTIGRALDTGIATERTVPIQGGWRCLKLVLACGC